MLELLHTNSARSVAYQYSANILRQHCYKIVKGDRFDIDNDDFALGHHLNEHGFNDIKDFKKVLNVCVLENCSPKVLDVKEYKYIHKLNFLTSQRINLSNPFSIHLLHK